MQLPVGALAPGAICPVDLDDGEFVLWRGNDGKVRSAPRICPHLDHDLVEGYVAGAELVCAGHGWAFDGNGSMYKRNEFGRVDHKGNVPRLAIDEHDGVIEITRIAE